MTVEVERYKVNFDSLAGLDDTGIFLDEFRRIEAVLEFIMNGYLEVQHVEPEKNREGRVVFADGVDWNPGSGAGLYEYRGGTWVKL